MHYTADSQKKTTLGVRSELQEKIGLFEGRWKLSDWYHVHFYILKIKTF